MTRLSWGDDERNYTHGIDRGVVHLHNTDEIVPWNGLISVTRGETDDSSSYAVFDGVAYANVKLGGVYTAEVKAYGVPYEMSGVIGEVEALPGFVLTGQKREQFDFIYRSMYGENHYKLHFVWNASLVEAGKTRKSLSDDIDPLERKWRVSAIPVVVPYWMPTAFLTVDSKTAQPDNLAAIENYIYGDDDTDPQFPSQLELLIMIIS